MQIHLEVPEDIAATLGPDERAVERAILEGFALEKVRTGELSRGQIRRLLGFGSRYEVDGFLKARGVPVETSFEEIRNSGQAILARRQG